MIKVKDSSCVCREFFTLNAYLLNSTYQIWVKSINVYQKTFKRTFQTRFWVQNYFLKLFSRVVNSQRLLCSKNIYQIYCIAYDYKLTFMNTQHKNTNSKGDFLLKNQFSTFIQIFLLYKINITFGMTISINKHLR